MHVLPFQNVLYFYFLCQGSAAYDWDENIYIYIYVDTGGNQLATFDMCLQGVVFDKADGGGDGGAGGVGAGGGQLATLKMCLQGGII